MNTQTEQSAHVCAAPDVEMNWHSIDWSQVHGNVRKLQTRIVKAIEEGRWGKAKALQRLLTHSFSGKALAVRRVTENQGKKTPGVDGVTWDTPAAKADAIAAMKQHGYKPMPLRRVNIPKANGKMRPLGIPTMKDRAMQALHALALVPVAETTADADSYGFRQERSAHDAIEQCFKALTKQTSPEWVLEGDIKGCFDNINHNWMLANIPTDKATLKKWLTAGVVEQGKFSATEAGTPQGGIISPVLANMVLDGLQKELAKRYRKVQVGRDKQTGKVIHHNPKVHFVRYADDFIITAASKEMLEDEIKPLVQSFMAERGLELSLEKTVVTHISEGFDFLGQNIRKFNGKLIIQPSKRSVKNVLDKVRKLVSENKTAPQRVLIGKLNPVLKGWAEYHKHAVSSATFHKVDNEVWKTLWQWAKRRHKNKSLIWVKEKYFIQRGGRNWVFAADTGEISETGKPVMLSLRKMSDVKIRRHVKVKSEANPFSPKWEQYFEERLSLKMKNSLVGRRKLLSLWNLQEGRCLVCDQLVTKDTGWHVHHRKPRAQGGDDKLTNLALLHPFCHNKVHASGRSSLLV